MSRTQPEHHANMSRRQEIIDAIRTRLQGLNFFLKVVEMNGSDFEKSDLPAVTFGEGMTEISYPGRREDLRRHAMRVVFTVAVAETGDGGAATRAAMMKICEAIGLDQQTRTLNGLAHRVSQTRNSLDRDEFGQWLRTGTVEYLFEYVLNTEEI